MADGSMKAILLKAPPTQLDPSVFPLIATWDAEPKAVQILEVLDHVIFASLGSGFVVNLLQTLYETALLGENTTHEEVEKLAHWRKEIDAVEVVGRQIKGM